ncbi:DsrE family protein [Sinorhizobium medicae]|uniref:DsrE family protein n=1 Tax=Sinorhizobium medicae TaxID=110321 RepID=UPI001F420B55|nr:DsrE family protein [Sinorhizobium medicae]WQO47466.1 DsrE family protein [Sinorhizobium medicae]WQO60903.1 DsrE family protein [Sinorhizobium medicae]WQO67759.1 DsrE family protein [Sinorhizobium medicae]WQO74835.1 DsrE family protein [Sinorhizobium medicae]WQO94099.1 DsrE family protein [Sinorhizobium medicae]
MTSVIAFASACFWVLVNTPSTSLMFTKGMRISSSVPPSIGGGTNVGRHQSTSTTSLPLAFRCSIDDIADWNADAEVIVVFHTNAGHLTLHDEAYNASRKIAAGNPNRELIADLVTRGVEIELCGATAKANGWGNADLLPNVKINTDAMARTIQLVQQGFVKITEA